MRPATALPVDHISPCGTGTLFGEVTIGRQTAGTSVLYTPFPSSHFVRLSFHSAIVPQYVAAYSHSRRERARLGIKPRDPRAVVHASPTGATPSLSPAWTAGGPTGSGLASARRPRTPLVSCRMAPSPRSLCLTSAAARGSPCWTISTTAGSGRRCSSPACKVQRHLRPLRSSLPPLPRHGEHVAVW